jgi:hypothetical protein
MRVNQKLNGAFHGGVGIFQVARRMGLVVGDADQVSREGDRALMLRHSLAEPLHPPNAENFLTRGLGDGQE